MSKETTKDTPHKIGFVGINKVLLRNAATALEEQLKADAKTSKDIADLQPPWQAQLSVQKPCRLICPRKSQVCVIGFSRLN
jgi:hypothetical protein